MERNVDFPHLVQHRLAVPPAQQIFKLLHFCCRNHIIPCRNVNFIAKIQDLIQIRHAIPEVENQHFIAAVLLNLLKQPFPFFVFCSLNVHRRCGGRQIIQVLHRLDHSAQFVDDALIFLSRIIQNIAHPPVVAAFQQPFKSGIAFHIEIQHCPLLRQNLPHRQGKRGLLRPSDRRINADNTHFLFRQQCRRCIDTIFYAVARHNLADHLFR